MEKIKLGVIPLVYPTPIVLIGADVEGRPNFTEVGDCAIMGIEPALVAISLNAAHYTTGGIDGSGTFSINIPHTGQLSITDYCGRVSGRDVDKSALFRVFRGEQTQTPLIEECPVGLECRVRETVQIEQRRIFIAEVLECYVSPSFVAETEGGRRIASLNRLDPILYALDNQYYCVGPPVGVGYQEGVEPTPKT